VTRRTGGCDADVDRLACEPHALLLPAGLVTSLAAPLGEAPSPPWLLAWLALDAPSPFERDESLRQAVRDALRVDGYKPTGRGKPASEYLVRAATEGTLAGINLAVDACNAVSLHAGLPISVVDLDACRPPLRIEVVRSRQSYVFNAGGQEIELAGLPCLCDASGPCANAVKDAARTKTGPRTLRTLSIVWGVARLRERTERAIAWYRELLERAGARTERIDVSEAPPAGP
jgi:DNA/RNA-binding domain of Phe-tRNA-synthetase-like protein